MNHRPAASVGLLLLLAVVLGALIVMAASHLRDQEPVYSVDQVRIGLARNPQAWVGRTVSVRGIVPPLWQFRCPPGMDCPFFFQPRQDFYEVPVAQPSSLLLSEPASGTPLPGGRVIVSFAPLPSSFSGRKLPLFSDSAHSSGFLGGVPILQALLPGPQHLVRGRPVVYRLHLEDPGQDVCGYSPCYVGIVEDAVADSPLEPVPTIQPGADPTTVLATATP